MSCDCNGPMVGGKPKKNRRGTRKMGGGNVDGVNVEKGYFDTIKGLVGDASSWLKDKFKTEDSNQPLPVQSAGRSKKKAVLAFIVMKIDNIKNLKNLEN